MRWQVLEVAERGVIRLRGIDASFQDVEATPLIALEGRFSESDELPLPELEVGTTDRGRWRALHRAHQTPWQVGVSRRSASTGARSPWSRTNWFR